MGDGNKNIMINVFFLSTREIQRELTERGRMLKKIKIVHPSITHSPIYSILETEMI